MVIVTVLVAVASEHPPLPLTVYVIVDVPADTGLIAPLDPFTVATPVVPLVNAPPASPLLLNVVDPLEHTACVPLSVPAFGAAVAVPEADTLTVVAAVAEQATLPLGVPADVPEAIRTYTAVEDKVPLVGEKVMELV